MGTRRARDRGHRHAGGRAPQPRTRRAIPKALGGLLRYLRDGQILILRSTVYPGVTALVEKMIAALGIDIDVAFCPERIAEGKAMTELFELPQIVSARTARGAERASALFGRLTSQAGRDVSGGGRAGQAVHQRLAVHQVRHREPAVHDGQRPGPGLRADPAGTWPPTTRGRPTCRPRASPPGRACSRTPCSSPPTTTTTSRSATPRWRSTRACRCTWCTAWSSATTWPP